MNTRFDTALLTQPLSGQTKALMSGVTFAFCVVLGFCIIGCSASPDSDQLSFPAKANDQEKWKRICSESIPVEEGNSLEDQKNLLTGIWRQEGVSAYLHREYGKARKSDALYLDWSEPRLVYGKNYFFEQRKNFSEFTGIKEIWISKPLELKHYSGVRMLAFTTSERPELELPSYCVKFFYLFRGKDAQGVRILRTSSVSEERLSEAHPISVRDLEQKLMAADVEALQLFVMNAISPKAPRN